MLSLLSFYEIDILSESEFVDMTSRLLSFLFELRHVLFHLLDLAKQTVEVTLNSAKEVSERAIYLLHFLFNTNNALLELLTNVLTAVIALVVGNQHLLRLNLADLLWLELDAIVGAALVDYFNVGELVLHDVILDLRIVPILGLFLDVSVDGWVFGEYFAHQEFLR